MPKSSKEEVFLSERNILQELRINARQSPEGIAKKFGYSRQKVWRVLKKLEDDGVIWGYTAIVDMQKQGFKHYILLIKRTQKKLDDNISDKLLTGKFKEILCSGINDLSDHTFLEGCFYVYGEYDWVVSFYTKNILDAKELCENLQRNCSDYIEYINLLETMFVGKKNWIQNPLSINDIQTLKKIL